MSYFIEHMKMLFQAGELLNMARSFTKVNSYAEDLVQATLCSACANHHLFVPTRDDGADVRAWSRVTMRRIYIDNYHRAKRETEYVEGFVAPQYCDGGQFDHVRLQEVFSAITELSAEHQGALVDAVLGRQREETALQCGISPVTVRTRVNRAREELKERMEW